MGFADSLGFKQYEGPSSEIFAQIKLFTPGGHAIDFQGLDSLKMRLQLGAADELTIQLTAKNIDGDWRTDMPIWQVGAIILVHVGYDTFQDYIQKFEVVSTTMKYPSGAGAESMTIRGVSALARAARNKDPRVFDQNPGNDLEVVREIADEYGWSNDVESDDFLNLKHRAKQSGKSDLDLLKLIAKQGRLGGPRVDGFDTLSMPRPVIGKLKFTRGIGDPDARRLHSLSMERDGASQTRVIVVAWNPETEQWVEKQFEADKFSQDPVLVFEGNKAEKALTVSPGGDIKTNTLTLAVVERSGSGKKERVDVINSAVYDRNDGLTAEELVRRYFELREKLSRWATIKVDGHSDLIPYVSIQLQGDLAEVDKGNWLPLWCEHTIDSNGWTVSSRVIRIVEEKNFPINAVED